MQNLHILLLCYTFLYFLCITSFAVDTITPNQSIVDGQELVSSGESFVLGFFSPGDSKKRHLGIWFKNISPLTIVWVANRENPLNDSYGHLSIGADGNIVLRDGAENIIWSSKSSRAIKVSIAKLLDSGNLVLMDGSDGNTDSYIWQSFENPADTLLPGMKLGWDVKTGLHLFLTSWKSGDDLLLETSPTALALVDYLKLSFSRDHLSNSEVGYGMVYILIPKIGILLQPSKQTSS